MSELSAFHHVSLSVRSCDASAEWYRTVLGFEERFREEHPERRACVMGFAGAGFSVAVVEHLPVREEDFDPTRRGLDHLAFSVSSSEEMAGWATRLDDAGVIHSGVIDIPPGAILNFKDPDGIALSLFWERH
jgi:glyoxylase I family protein